MVMYLPAPPQVYGLDHTTQNILDQAWQQWAAKLPRNIERLIYLDGKNKLKDLRISIPPELLDDLNVVSGWAEKAVTEPANRTIWEGMLDEDGNPDPFDLRHLLYRNRYAVEFPQGVRASMTYSCAFQSVTPGDVLSGEPEVLIMHHSAMWATGLWNARLRELSAGLLVGAVDVLGAPTEIMLLTPFETLVCRKMAGGWILADRIKNPLGRCGLELMPLAPDLDRPFGRARVDRRVMSIVDRVVRAGSRLDVHSEAFSALKLFLLGADESAFTDEQGRTIPLWSYYMSRMNTLGVNEEGELPKIEKISAESPEPHIATLRQLASEFSGHTGVPLGSLGIAQDNPESADAKNVAREDIMFMVKQQHTVYGHAKRRTFENAIMIRDRLTEPPREIADLELLWRRPDHASDAALADAGMKQVTAAELQGTETGMRMIGMSEARIRQAVAEKRRMAAGTVLDRLTADGALAEGEEVAGEAALRDAQIVKAQLDALGVGVRAGADPTEVAEKVGLAGIKMTGAVPVSLRMPQDEANDLEEK
ncbi:phage portal protein [Leucobacter muris]|uniref:Phage portal protein n=1 Tax=Leucobacter muris TaxID=1935379 RepID=A0ABX5QDH7_9MICO|nr:phage portal protein [Leucobacter muris]QAB17123.1 phage portal protein [Leucobacter muris]